MVRSIRVVLAPQLLEKVRPVSEPFRKIVLLYLFVDDLNQRLSEVH